MQVLEAEGRRGFAFAWQMLRNRDDALDAVQSAMESVWRTRKRLEAGRDLRPWFYRVLRNRCVDVLRTRYTRATAPLESDPPARDGLDPSQSAAKNEQLDRLRRELAGLPDEMREIILLRDYQDLPYAEIARVLDIPKGTVMSRLHRARSALRERMLADE